MENIVNGARSSLDFAQLGELKGRAKRHEESALKETAQQFEAMFLQMMLKTMREAVPRSGFMDSDSVKTYESMYDRELSLHLAQKNSIGIADMLVESLSQKNNNKAGNTQDFLLQHPGVKNKMLLNNDAQSDYPINNKKQIFNISKPEPSAFPLKRNFDTNSPVKNNGVGE